MCEPLDKVELDRQVRISACLTHRPLHGPGPAGPSEAGMFFPLQEIKERSQKSVLLCCVCSFGTAFAQTSVEQDDDVVHSFVSDNLGILWPASSTSSDLALLL